MKLVQRRRFLEQNPNLLHRHKDLCCQLVGAVHIVVATDLIEMFFERLSHLYKVYEASK